jgi:cysteine-rich repeat protein
VALAARPGVDLDTGWSGISHDLPGVDDAPTTSARLSGCDTSLASPTCGQCNVAGPIKYQGPANTCRCYNAASPDTSTLTSCDPEAPACSGGQSCQCFYGPPLPLSSGAVPVCVINRFNGTFAGTINVANTGTHAGKGASEVHLISSVYNGLGATNPCPKCNGDVTARDGLAQGTCAGGARDGMPCDTAGLNVYFGATSLDCPPATAGSIGDLQVNFKPATTGTTTLGTDRPCTATGGVPCFCNTCPTAANEPCNTNADCPGSLRCGGKRCLSGTNQGTPCTATSECPSSSCGVPGNPTQQNGCIGGTCEPNPSDPTNPTDGICPEGPVDRACSLEPYRGCTADVDCNPAPAGNCIDCFADQTCEMVPRQCFLDPIVRTGTPGTRDSIVAATFCLPPTRSASINNVAGLPGPGAVLQPTRTFRIGPLCGNGVVDTGESCDGGSDVSWPGECGIDCQCPAAAVCGDGEVNQPSEECDGTDDATCPGLCQGNCTCAPYCGDGDVNQPSEVCDDGNAVDGDGCDSNCTTTTCGNGIQTGAEQCDGGDASACNGSTCKPDCTCNPFCGDGVKNQPGEACDGTDHGACGVPPGTGTCELDCTCADFCGNNVREGAESCDGSDATACPGACGGDCTCPKIGSLTFSTVPGADLDTGWTGSSHNFSIQTCAQIPGDLGGCNPTLGDNECTFFANVGSFCSGNPAISCTDNTACVGNGSCVITPYGAPLPLSSGGVPVCILNRFAGDVTGTYNLLSGAAEITVPLNSIVTLATDSNVPCPTCNCTSPPCDCGDTGTCSNNPLTSCTVGGVGPFGPTSNDCQPTGPNVSGGGLNIAFAPATTGTRTFPSNTPCTGSGFTQYGCWIAGESQPSACLKGCDGGANDGLECSADGDCPGGTGTHPCQPLCRHDSALDPGPGGVNEGRCVLGPVDKTCAAASQITCSQDSDCIGGVGPCVTVVRRCFMDPIVRTGVPGTSTLTLASTFPIPGTSSPAVNSTAGLPGPGAIRYPQTLVAAYCGDNQLNQASEECDGSADANCPGACNDSACLCNVECGNDSVDFGEQCDGTGLPQCGAGQTCSAPGNADECTCTPAICGDGFKAAAEQCDPGAPPSTPADDAACPGECQAALCTCPAPVCGDGVIEGTEVCELPAVGCGALQVCAGCTGCMP